MTDNESATPATTRLRRRFFDVLEGGFDSPRAKFINGFIVALILINVIAVVLESEPGLFVEYKSVFYAVEIFSVGIFTLEYLARIWCWPENPAVAGESSFKQRLKFVFSPLGLIDLLAIAPFYIAMVFTIDLRYLRLLRLMRLLKISHYFHGLDLFADVLRSEARTIAAAVLTVLMLIIVVAALMFAFEHDAQPEAFGSILQSIWWSVVTLTTVGYGDVTPVTFAGRVLAIIIMLLGVGLVALPAGILAAKFSDELKSRRDHLSSALNVALADGVVDEDEHAELSELRKELRLSEGVLEQMLESRAGSTAQFRCPGCGHALTMNLSAPDSPEDK